MWEMYAHKYENGEFWHSHSDKRIVALYGTKLPIVPVRIIESPEGKYYGYIRTGKTIPEMIYPNWNLFTVCFAYGPEVEVEKGNGRIVRLDVVECPEVGEPS